MFTGIVEELGEVVAVQPRGDCAVVTIRGPKVAADARHGDSIAVNGACLTVTVVRGELFEADVMAETLARTTLGEAVPGSMVNLERPVAPVGRLGGHVVQGHVDETGVVLARTPGERWELVRIGLPARLSRYVVEKGSIAVDGVSLTVATVAAEHFDVGLIPTTLVATTLGDRRVGQRVNLEVDVLAKYVERLLPVSRDVAPVAAGETGHERGGQS